MVFVKCVERHVCSHGTFSSKLWVPEALHNLRLLGSPTLQRAGCSHVQERRSPCLGGCRSTSPSVSSITEPSAPRWAQPWDSSLLPRSRFPWMAAEAEQPSFPKKTLLLGEIFCRDWQTIPHLVRAMKWWEKCPYYAQESQTRAESPPSIPHLRHSACASQASQAFTQPCASLAAHYILLWKYLCKLILFSLKKRKKKRHLTTALEKPVSRKLAMELGFGSVCVCVCVNKGNK